jgi:biopolymer transport protein TolR
MGASATRSRGGRRALSDINVTPFVDVMLVLLIIFMVTAPLMQQGIDVDLPDTTTQPIRVKNDPLILSVKKDGSYYLGRKQVTREELVTKLEAVFDARGSDEIFLRADEKAPYGVVVQAMAAARQAGSKQLGIVTEQER